MNTTFIILYSRLILHSQSLQNTKCSPKMRIKEKYNVHYYSKPVKSRLPTPPSSPKCSDQENSHEKKNTPQNTKTNNINTFVPKVFPKTEREKCAHLKQYESDDSGKGDSEWSDLSESSDLYSPRPSCQARYVEEEKLKMVDMPVPGNISSKLHVLKMSEYNIKQKISQNSDEISNFLISLSSSVKYPQIVKIQSYVEDLEKITFLLHSLARRLAVAERKIKLMDFNFLEEEEEWRRKYKKLSKQLEEAKDIKEILDKKFEAISNYLEKYKSSQAKIRFGNLMEKKIKLMITFKEGEDKIKIQD